MNQRHLRIAVGLFVSITLLLLVAATGFVLHRKGLFSEEFHFTLVADSGQHLSAGMPVLFQGLKVGSVDSLRLTPAGRVEADVSVPEDERRWLRRSTTFTVEKPLLGGARVVVATPDMSAPLLAEGSRTRARIQDDINQLIQKAQPVVRDLQEIVDHLNAVSARVADPEGDLQQSLGHFERFSGRLADEPALLTLLTDDPGTADHVTALLKRAESGTGEAEALLAELRRTVARARGRLLADGGTVDRVDALLDDVKAKLEVLDPAVREAARSTDGLEQLRDELQITIEDTRGILDRIESVLGDNGPGEVRLP
jgi:phospholipid/cholesterol/gamma-HCH transport system substrate-binding protein